MPEKRKSPKPLRRDVDLAAQRLPDAQQADTDPRRSDAGVLRDFLRRIAFEALFHQVAITHAAMSEKTIQLDCGYVDGTAGAIVLQIQRHRRGHAKRARYRFLAMEFTQYPTRTGSRS